MESHKVPWFQSPPSASYICIGICMGFWGYSIPHVGPKMNGHARASLARSRGRPWHWWWDMVCELEGHRAPRFVLVSVLVHGEYCFEGLINLNCVLVNVLFWPATNEWSAPGGAVWSELISPWCYMMKNMGPTAPRNLGWLPSLLMERTPLVGLKRSNEQHHMSSLWMLSDM